VATDWEGDDRYHRSVRATLRSREGAEWSVEGEVLNLIPLRNRRQSPDGETMVTRISEGMTRWRLTGGTDGDGGEVAGRVGYGLSEYLDQIIDGAPVGIDE
jgi:hypothetical protein